MGEIAAEPGLARRGSSLGLDPDTQGAITCWPHGSGSTLQGHDCRSERPGRGAVEDRRARGPAPSAPGRRRTLPYHPRWPKARGEPLEGGRGRLHAGPGSEAAPPAPGPAPTLTGINEQTTAPTAPERAEASPLPAGTALAPGYTPLPLPGLQSR